jgi:hypothetical protein
VVCVRGLVLWMGVVRMLVLVWLCCVCCVVASEAWAVGEGRVYELVSPVYKGGYGVLLIDGVAPGVGGVAFTSLGAFAGTPGADVGNTYIAHRGVGGWSTVPLVPPVSLTPMVGLGAGGLGAGVVDFSPDLGSVLALGKLGPSTAENSTSTLGEFFSHSTSAPDVEGEWRPVGMVVEPLLKKSFDFSLEILPEGENSDFSHIIFNAAPLEYLLPEAVGTASQAYELSVSDGCGRLGSLVCREGPGGSSLRLVGLDDEGRVIDPHCTVYVGAGAPYGGLGQGKDSSFGAVSADGETIFFTSFVPSPRDETGCGNGGHAAVLFARVGGVRTVSVSGPAAGGCVAPAPCSSEPPANAEFAGASEDGSVVFFTMAQPSPSPTEPLANGELYMARIGCAGGDAVCEPVAREVVSLVQVSHDANGPADVQGAVSVARDGSRIYFVAHGVLNENRNAQGASAVRGADNLYAYDRVSGDPPMFVAELCSGRGVSGGVEDVHCPGGSDSQLWLGAAEVQTGGSDGRFLVFSSYGQLTGDDTDSARDVYRYDAVTGVLDRVSIGENGFDANGNNDAFDAALRQADNQKDSLWFEHVLLNSRAVSEDGSRIVFDTVEPLSAAAVNGVDNVYVWRKEPGWDTGVLSLVSTGSSSEPSGDEVVSPAGGDIFFVTSQGLVSQDTDGLPDIYDARVGGGFPEPPAERVPCSGDACQGSLTNPAPLLVPGSMAQARETVSSPKPAVSKRHVSKRKAKRKHRRHGAQAHKGKRARRRRGG